MGKHRKPKAVEAKHAKPHEQSKVARKVAILGAGAVAVPVTALTFTPSAMAATTENIPRVVIPAAVDGGSVPAPSTPAKCADYIVKPGDTFSGVGLTYGVDLTLLKSLNPGVAKHKADYSLVFAGGHIHLPDGSCDPVSPPPAPAPTPPPSPSGHTWKHHQHRHHEWRHGGEGGGTPVPTPTPTPPPVVTPPPVGGSFVPIIAPDGPGTPSGYVAHSPSFWAPLIRQAMGLVGGRVNANQDVSGVESLMAAESSGDPNAINLSDSNAAAGHPSKGLMQTIQATFDANHVAGTSSNIYDPLANLCAALRYINAQYGGNIPSSPY